MYVLFCYFSEKAERKKMILPITKLKVHLLCGLMNYHGCEFFLMIWFLMCAHIFFLHTIKIKDLSIPRLFTIHIVLYKCLSLLCTIVPSHASVLIMNTWRLHLELSRHYMATTCHVSLILLLNRFFYKNKRRHHGISQSDLHCSEARGDALFRYLYAQLNV